MWNFYGDAAGMPAGCCYWTKARENMIFLIKKQRAA